LAISVAGASAGIHPKAKAMDIEVAVTGRIGADPEKRISKANKPWVRLAVACDGTWLSIACFGDLADVADKIERGAMVYAEGALQIKQGDNGKVYLNVRLQGPGPWPHRQAARREGQGSRARSGA
jgi:single-stranded DNA-binding protein